MPLHSSTERRAAIIGERLIKYYMPDRCQIFPLSRTTNDAGMWQETNSEPRVWRGSQEIPCRLDPTRIYRSEDIYGQEVIVNEYTINLPYDVLLQADEVVVYNGTRFQVRKLMNRHSSATVVRALVVEVQ